MFPADARIIALLPATLLTFLVSRTASRTVNVVAAGRSKGRSVRTWSVHRLRWQSVMQWRSTRGFSVIELMLVVSIIGIVSSISVVQIGNALPGMKSDGAMRVVMSQLNTARNLAVAQRRYMRVNFLLPSKIQIVRVEVNSSGTVTGTTTLSTVDFEGGVTYNKISGLIDTPDGLGMASAVDFGTATTIQFATDGSLVDQTGSPLNGTIVLANANNKTSSRAITVLGSTGHIRAYKWNGAAWTLV